MILFWGMLLRKIRGRKKDKRRSNVQQQKRRNYGRNRQRRTY